MDEELLNDQQYRQLNPTRHYELITKYCAGIEYLAIKLYCLVCIFVEPEKWRNSWCV